MAEKTIWGIHARSEGEADSLFVKNEVIDIDGYLVGELTPYKDKVLLMVMTK